MMKNLLLYDFLLAKGGAEKLSLELCNTIEELDLLVGFVSKQNFPELTIPNGTLHTLKSPFLNPVLHAVLLSQAFARTDFNLNKYDKVLFSGAYAPLAVKQRKAGKTNYMYCHTPPRFVYDLKEHYLSEMPAFKRYFFNILVDWFQPQYEAAIAEMEVIIANSENVKSRIFKYLNKDAEVIYPPIKTDEFNWLEEGDYFLSTARLEPYKRVDRIVKAFMRMPDKKLVVASGGSELKALKRLASGHENIFFTGWQTNKQMQELVGRALATIYIPKDEDFGMSPVESMAAGKPALGVAEGGVKETVIDGYNGFLLKEDPTELDIIEKVSSLNTLTILKMRNDCTAFAKRFDSAVFKAKMCSLMSPTR